MMIQYKIMITDTYYICNMHLFKVFILFHCACVDYPNIVIQI